MTQGFLHLPGFIKEHGEILDFLKQQQFLEDRECWFEVSQGVHPGFLEFEKKLAPMAQQILGSQALLESVQVSNVPTNELAWQKCHIDGENHVMVKGKTFDGVPWCKIILGIFLTKIQKDTGELCVYPKGHSIVQNFFKKNAHRFWKDGVFVADAKKAYLELMENLPEKLLPIYAEPGDLVLLHCMVPHALGNNFGEKRPVTYYRYGRYKEPGEKALTSMWQGFEGLEKNGWLENINICQSGSTIDQ